MHDVALSQDIPTSNSFSLVSLIRLIRNVMHHLPEPKTRDEIKRLIAPVPTVAAAVANYFLSRFPRFNLPTINILFYFVNADC